MRYNISTGVEKSKSNMKKYLLGAAAAGLMATGIAVPALAAGAGDGSQASSSGACHGAFADVNGNFGWLGPLGGTPGYHGAVGQTPPATGYNNSHDCPH